MELLLNLLWLHLTVLALWAWRRQDRSFDSLRCLLLLVCSLVLLFPVISATDDLQAMRLETEESSSPKRFLKQGTIEKASGQNDVPNPPTDVTLISAVRPHVLFWGQPFVEQLFPPAEAQTPILPSRGPPDPFLS